MALITDVDASAVYLPLFVLDDTGARRYVLPASYVVSLSRGTGHSKTTSKASAV
jgi:hypothetical protein